MCKKAALAVLLYISTAIVAKAQTTYLQLGTEDYNVLDRLETRSGQLSNDLFLGVKPTQRKGMVKFLMQQADDSNSNNLSRIDKYNIAHAISTSGEWTDDENGAINSKRPWFNTFYKKQADFVYVKTKDFFFSVNPVITGQLAYDKDNKRNPLFTSNRGVEVRGWIAKKLGFYTFFTDNQENVPAYVSQWIDTNHAVPGADFYIRRKNQPGYYDYLLARGYIDFAAVKDHINVTFGYDKNFIGDGMRSLFLSDFSAGATFLRLNTRVWKLNYENLFMELTPSFKLNGDKLQPHKYATMHHLSVNATKWLNVGAFETVIFDRVNRYEASYLIPIILYRQTERALGSPDNVMLGINFKALAAKHLQFYGQLILDEFTSKELVAGNGYWANKFGVQLGGKYFDAFTVKNLDLQAELNVVRPFTYSHFDTVANYTHYNQALAHPLGASFAEILAVARYQPVKNLFLTLKGMYYKKGADTSGTNFGNNIMLDYDTRTTIPGEKRNYGYELISGVKTQCATLSLNASYELRENLFVDMGGTYRRFAWENGLYPTQNNMYMYGGFRLNFARRDYNFF
ncbi:MAG: hypothetical protein EOP51_15745 [Sphingobacteriales bacterium]|nr:MAG: hypothetical protein EOP51_15745 [Sphingobacteriales bacterium]